MGGSVSQFTVVLDNCVNCVESKDLTAKAVLSHLRGANVDLSDFRRLNLVLLDKRRELPANALRPLEAPIRKDQPIVGARIRGAFAQNGLYPLKRTAGPNPANSRQFVGELARHRDLIGQAHCPFAPVTSIRGVE